MVIDQHFGFIAFAWLAGIAGFAGIGLWLWLDRRGLDRQLSELERQGHDVRRLKGGE
ncbi:MAG: heme exporter protein CcmD [Pseudomonadota bacterium]